MASPADHPSHSVRPSRRQRFIVALSAAAFVAVSGALVAPTGHADPDLSLEEAQDRVDQLYHKAEQATERYNGATDELSDVQRRLERAQRGVDRQRAKLKDITSDMGGFAAASYRAGGVDPTIEVMLADNPEEFLSRASVVDAYAAQQADQLAAVAAERQRLEQNVLLVEEERSRLKAIEAELEQEKSTVESLLAEAEELLSELEAEERARLEAERRERARQAAIEAAARSQAREEEPPEAEVPVSGKAGTVAEFALAQLGDPYQWAGNGPDAWDCSGLTKAAWAQAGVSLPRTSSDQINAGTRVSRDQLQAGDLVFYYSPISHVGIYIGNGEIVHATHPGDVVSLDSVDSMPYSGASRPG